MSLELQVQWERGPKRSYYLKSTAVFFLSWAWSNKQTTNPDQRTSDSYSDRLDSDIREERGETCNSGPHPDTICGRCSSCYHEAVPYISLFTFRVKCNIFEGALLNSDVLICLSSSLDAELVIPATGNVFYAMTSSSVDFLLRRKGGNTPLGLQPISTETSATFPRIKAKGRRLVRTLFWHQTFVHNDGFFS